MRKIIVMLSGKIVRKFRLVLIVSRIKQKRVVKNQMHYVFDLAISKNETRFAEAITLCGNKGRS